MYYDAGVTQQVLYVIWCFAKCSMTVSNKVNTVGEMKIKLNDRSIFFRKTQKKKKKVGEIFCIQMIRLLSKLTVFFSFD